MEKEVIIISAIWCPSCLILNKHLKRIKKEYPDINIKKLDYDLDEEEVTTYNVGIKLPVIIIKENKRLVNFVNSGYNICSVKIPYLITNSELYSIAELFKDLSRTNILLIHSENIIHRE